MDRDGTISEEVGYVNHTDRFALLPRSADAIRKLNTAGLKAVVITNQAGVARGYFKEDLVHQTHEKMKSLLAQQQAYVDGIYYCPHHPSAGEPPYRQKCSCRKPEPGLLLQAAQDLGLDLARSFMIGDKISDVYLAHKVGAKGILVLTGYGKGEWEYQRQDWKQQPDYIAEDLYAAVEWIVKSEG